MPWSINSEEALLRVNESAIRNAQRIVGIAIGGCLAMWWAPFVGGFACNVAEKRMVRELLAVLDCDTSDDTASNLFWFVRPPEAMCFKSGNLHPIRRTAFQLLEVYALGQFTIHCATHFGITNSEHLAASWGVVEEQIFSGDA
jgi:hypothetical protein